LQDVGKIRGAYKVTVGGYSVARRGDKNTKKTKKKEQKEKKKKDRKKAHPPNNTRLTESEPPLKRGEGSSSQRNTFVIERTDCETQTFFLTQGIYRERNDGRRM